MSSVRAITQVDSKLPLTHRLERPTDLIDTFPIVSDSNFDRIGQLIAARYRLERRLGQGGMGAVWLAVDSNTGRRVALKRPRRDAADAADLNRRLIEEAVTLATLQHPHIVTALDAGLDDTGVPYLVQELLDGPTLRDILRRHGTLPWPRARRLLMQLCDAVAHAHHRGILHRDLKPENVILTPDSTLVDHCKLIDFGLAKPLTFDLAQTGSHQELGTPHYMSPEQIRGEPLGPRSDVYALGLVAFELLAGHRPFDGRSRYEICAGHVEGVLPSLPKQVPPHVEQLVRRALEKRPEARFGSAAELHRAIGGENHL